MKEIRIHDLSCVTGGMKAPWPCFADDLVCSIIVGGGIGLLVLGPVGFVLGSGGTFVAFAGDHVGRARGR